MLKWKKLSFLATLLICVGVFTALAVSGCGGGSGSGSGTNPTKSPTQSPTQSPTKSPTPSPTKTTEPDDKAAIEIDAGLTSASEKVMAKLLQGAENFDIELYRNGQLREKRHFVPAAKASGSNVGYKTAVRNGVTYAALIYNNLDPDIDVDSMRLVYRDKHNQYLGAGNIPGSKFKKLVEGKTQVYSCLGKAGDSFTAQSKKQENSTSSLRFSCSEEAIYGGNSGDYAYIDAVLYSADFKRDVTDSCTFTANPSNAVSIEKSGRLSSKLTYATTATIKAVYNGEIGRISADNDVTIKIKKDTGKTVVSYSIESNGKPMEKLYLPTAHASSEPSVLLRLTANYKDGSKDYCKWPENSSLTSDSDQFNVVSGDWYQQITSINVELGDSATFTAQVNGKTIATLPAQAVEFHALPASIDPNDGNSYQEIDIEPGQSAQIKLWKEIAEGRYELLKEEFTPVDNQGKLTTSFNKSTGIYTVTAPAGTNWYSGDLRFKKDGIALRGDAYHFWGNVYYNVRPSLQAMYAIPRGYICADYEPSSGKWWFGGELCDHFVALDDQGQDASDPTAWPRVASTLTVDHSYSRYDIGEGILFRYGDSLYTRGYSFFTSSSDEEYLTCDYGDFYAQKVTPAGQPVRAIFTSESNPNISTYAEITIVPEETEEILALYIAPYDYECADYDEDSGMWTFEGEYYDHFVAKDGNGQDASDPTQWPIITRTCEVDEVFYVGFLYGNVIAEYENSVYKRYSDYVITSADTEYLSYAGGDFKAKKLTPAGQPVRVNFTSESNPNVSAYAEITIACAQKMYAVPYGYNCAYYNENLGKWRFADGSSTYYDHFVAKDDQGQPANNPTAWPPVTKTCQVDDVFLDYQLHCGIVVEYSNSTYKFFDYGDISAVYSLASANEEYLSYDGSGFFYAQKVTPAGQPVQIIFTNLKYPSIDPIHAEVTITNQEN